MAWARRPRHARGTQPRVTARHSTGGVPRERPRAPRQAQRDSCKAWALAGEPSTAHYRERTLQSFLVEGSGLGHMGRSDTRNDGGRTHYAPRSHATLHCRTAELGAELADPAPLFLTTFRRTHIIGLSSPRAQNKKSHLTSETLGISNVSVLFITKPRKKALKNSWCE